MSSYLDKVVGRRFVLRIAAVLAGLGLTRLTLKAQRAKVKTKISLTAVAAGCGLPENIAPPGVSSGGIAMNTFSSKLPWAARDDGGFEQENNQGRRMVIQKDGATSIYGRDGKLVLSSKFQQAADLYRALAKSKEMLNKTR